MLVGGVLVAGVLVRGVLVCVLLGWLRNWQRLVRQILHIRLLHRVSLVVGIIVRNTVSCVWLILLLSHGRAVVTMSLISGHDAIL